VKPEGAGAVAPLLLVALHHFCSVDQDVVHGSFSGNLAPADLDSPLMRLAVGGRTD
jgi:hypothetical protein